MTLRSRSPWPSASIVRFVHNLPNFARLYWRLMRDRRVSVWPKALLVLSIFYAISPFDFLPDVIPLIGQVDDLVIVILVLRLFIYLCPSAVVGEHVRNISAAS